MAKKKRLPIEQLKEAGKQARQMLVKKGFITEESTIDKILKKDKAPTLPGIPAYLPHQWTIQASQRMMMDLLVIWKNECIKNNTYAEDLTGFFKFVIKELRRQEKKFEKEMNDMPKLLKSMKEIPVLKDVFSPMRKKESMHAMQRFFVDSFAVGIAIKNLQSVSEYANRFIDWTQELYAIWQKPEEKNHERI